MRFVLYEARAETIPLAAVGAHPHPVHHHVHRVLGVLLQPRGGVEQFGGDFGGAADDEGVGAGEGREQLLLARVGVLQVPEL